MIQIQCNVGLILVQFARESELVQVQMVSFLIWCNVDAILVQFTIVSVGVSKFVQFAR